MGIGEDYYPLPWSLLTYTPRLEGYEINVGEQQLKGAPKYSAHETLDWNRGGQAIDDYYDVPPYWGVWAHRTRPLSGGPVVGIRPVGPRC
jgi:hypothetical protein